VMQMRHKLPHIYRCYEKIVESWKGVFEVERWHDHLVRWCRGDVLMVEAAQNKPPQTTVPCHRGKSGPPLGWQSPFATETGGLFQTGNSVASAERTSAAQPGNTPRPAPNRVIPGSRAPLGWLTRDPVF